MFLRKHLYLWLLWPNRQNYTLSCGLVLKPRAKQPILILMVYTFTILYKNIIFIHYTAAYDFGIL